MPKKTTKQVFKINSEEILKKIKHIIEEGNVRRISVKDKEGKMIAEFPLTVGVVGAVLAPVLAALGAIAALATECSIVIEKEE